MTLAGAHGSDDPCWGIGWLRSNCSLRWLPALARVYIAETSSRPNRLGESQGNLGLMQRNDRAVPAGAAVMSSCTAEMPALALPLNLLGR